MELYKNKTGSQEWRHEENNSNRPGKRIPCPVTPGELLPGHAALSKKGSLTPTLNHTYDKT